MVDKVEDATILSAIRTILSKKVKEEDLREESARHPAHIFKKEHKKKRRLPFGHLKLRLPIMHIFVCSFGLDSE